MRLGINTREAAERFLCEQAEADEPCCYGHYGCSNVEGGPCLDETLCNFPDLAD